jgi:RNA polymerase sigma factor (sigma-70 family)
MATPKRCVERDDEDLVRLYLNDVGQFGLLSKDDEVRLAQQIEAGNTARELLSASDRLAPGKQRELRRAVRHGADAQQTFVQSNLRLVVSIAKKYQRSDLPLLDLIQEGNLGLLRAVEKFDWRLGFKFSTYATWWIRQAVHRGITDSGRMIRLPEHASATLDRVLQARSRLETTLHRPATLTEVAAEVELSETKVAEVLRFATVPLSLAQPVGDSEAELGDFLEDRDQVSPPDAAMRALLPSRVACLLEVLDQRERRLIALRFGLDRGDPRTLAEVAEHFNVSRERIRQIEARAMSKLQHPSTGVDPRELLDA